MPRKFRDFCFEFLNVRQPLLKDPRLLFPLSDLALDDQEAGPERSGVRRPCLLTSESHKHVGEAVKKVPGVTDFNTLSLLPFFSCWDVTEKKAASLPITTALAC